MKDEIKEILDRLDFNEWEVDLYKVPITWCEMYDIRDYITNLQEENEKLKQSILNAIDKMNSEMVMINDRGYYYTDISALEDILQINDKNFIDYKSRNEKAIEYIKQNSKCGGSFIDDKFVIEYIDEIFNGMELLNILNGDDE